MRNFEIVRDWQNAFFTRPVGAPRRSVPSDTLAAWVEAVERREQAERDEDARFARRHRAMREEADRAELRTLVRRFGRAAIETLARRSDPAFVLPADLLDEEDTDGSD